MALRAQSYTFTTVAGLPGANGSTDGPRGALFSAPHNIAHDSAGNLYVADTANHTVRKITSAGVVSTFAGKSGSSGTTDGIGSDARFNQPSGLAVDSSGSLYVADLNNHTIRKITSAGVVSTMAGTAGSAGATDGTGAAARFSSPSGITIDSSGNFFVADSANNTIRRMTSSGVVTTLAGSAGNTGSADGTGTVARFSTPTDVTADGAGNLYVADSGNHTIRKITSAGAVSTLAGAAGASGLTNATGGSARFMTPRGVSVDSNGNVFVADTGSNRIRRVSSDGIVSTLAGNGAGSSGATDDSNNDARFNGPRGLTVDSTGSVYVADTANHTIRKVFNGSTSTFAGTASVAGAADGSGRGSRFNTPRGIAVDGAGNLYVADSNNDTLRKISATGTTTTLAGQAGNNGANVDGAGTSARFFRPRGVAVDLSGNVYVADANNQTIRKVTSTGVVTTLAGQAASTSSTDGTGNAARFNNPSAVAVDTNGNLYVADTGNHTIRKITTSGGTVTTFAGAAGSTGSTDGSGTAARFNAPEGVAVDSAGNVYVADSSNHTVRKISAGGAVSTLAGAAGSFGSTDGTGTAARFRFPTGIAVDSAGNIYVAEFNHTIRKITPSGVVTTIGGSTGVSGAADGEGATARFNSPGGLAVDSAGNLYVGDTNNNTVRAGAPGLPVLSSAATASIAAGSSFNYTATFSGVLTGPFGVNALPAGLAFDANTGAVSGTPSASGTFVVTFTATNGAGTGSGTLTLTVGTAASAPTITTQPAAQVVPAGNNVTFTVVATGFPTPTYQWRKDGTAIAGATASTFALTNVSATDTASYSVVVTNASGSVTSAAAVLAVTAAVPTAPAISVQPTAQVVAAGATVTLAVTASGTPAPTYQWRKDGTAIAGATASSLVLTAVSSADTASYSVVVTNSVGAVTSSTAIVAVTGGATVAAAITSQPASQAVVAGEAATFSVTATGTPAPTYQWFKDGAAISGATSRVLTLPAVSPGNSGNYTVTVSNSAATVTSAAAILLVNSPGAANPTSALSNLSVRTTMGSGQVLTVGAVLSGGTKTILIRAGGPTLAAFGVTGSMVDPRLDLYPNGATTPIVNDDWNASQAATFAAVGAFPFVPLSKDSAIAQSLSNSFTVQVRGTGPGVVLVEAYDVTGGFSARLVNVSARNQVGTGADILIAGLNISGTGTKQVLIRAVGPGLAAFGVPGTLADPKLEVYGSNGAIVATNDNWTASLAPTFTQVGAFGLPANSRDAALLTTLGAGSSYTVHVSGADGGTGEALIEVYEVF